MKKKTKIIFASLLLGTSFATVATGCKNLSGDYELTNFTVDTSAVALSYEIGDTVDLSGLIMKATYSDDETKAVAFSEVKIYLGNEDITANLSKITETAGNKTIKVVYSTEYGEKSKSFTITVKDEEVVLDSIDTFNTPAFLVAYRAQIEAAKTQTESTEESVFFKNEMDEYYMVGDDNAFKVVPVADALDFDTGEITALTNVTVNSTVKVLVGNVYQTLTKSVKEGAEYTYEYYNGETLLVTEDAKKNEFFFAPSAVGQIFNISILPDSTVYEVDSATDAIVMAVQIVDGYNVYNTKELAVLDNSKRESWVELKGQAGVANVDTNGVILHNTMALTATDIPEDFYYTLPEDYNVKYEDENGVSKTPEEWGMGRTFLKQHFDNYATNPDDTPNGTEDYVLIYQRAIGTGKTFSFYGNYFEVDASQIPLVCAFKANRDNQGNQYVNNEDTYETYYGDDFSNAVLFHITSQEQVWTCEDGHVESSEEPLSECSTCGKAVTGSEEGETFYFDNLAIRGNAQNKQLKVDVSTEGAVQNKECLVYAGGIILTKINNTKAKLDNVRNYNFFIPFFANKGASIEYNRTKCYDSFQNAIFAWGNTNVTVNKSIFKRAGGPLVILQHDLPDESDESLAIPHMQVSADSVMYSALSGSELWFKSVGATAIIPQFVQLDSLFMMAGKTIYKGRKATDTTGIGEGKMNIVALLMRDGTNATTALGSLAAQGSFLYGDATDENAPRLDRMTNTQLGVTVRGVLSATANTTTVTAPVFNIGNQVFYFDGTTVRDTMNADASMAFMMALQSANHIGFNQGGLSVLFEISPLA
ncbi:MAG: hypothetical protein E7381_00690 [Clostridiales bacterium]|nr:hypothetical protein [Clostridiales bacterium]